MAVSMVDQKRYELINQCYTTFVHDRPPARTMFSVVEKDRSIFWHTALKKYIIFEHTMIIGGLKVRLTSFKNLDALI